jgi:virginiamycin B lyase
VAFAITAGADGNLWFTESHRTGNDSIGRISPTGAIREFPLPDSGIVNGIVAGPDGNLWFTEAVFDSQSQMYSASQIGRVSTNATFQEYPLPDRLNVPFSLAVGPDGNLWFTEPGTNTIGRLVTLLADLGIGETVT